MHACVPGQRSCRATSMVETRIDAWAPLVAAVAVAVVAAVAADHDYRDDCDDDDADNDDAPVL